MHDQVPFSEDISWGILRKRLENFCLKKYPKRLNSIPKENPYFSVTSDTAAHVALNLPSHTDYTEFCSWQKLEYGNVEEFRSDTIEQEYDEVSSSAELTEALRPPAQSNQIFEEKSIQCSNCKFFHLHGTDRKGWAASTASECRRYPPVPMYSSHGNKNAYFSYFPQVESTQSCGEFVKKY